MTATTSSPWSREAPPSVTLPVPPAPMQPPPGPPHQLQVRPGQARSRLWAWTALALLLVVTVSAGVSAAITYIALHGAGSSSSSTAPSVAAASSPTTTPRFSPAEIANAKGNLCHIFDVSVRGQEGQGGLRAEGKVNLPIVLRALNSASVVQNALSPAVPANIADAARTYVSTTLDATTAAMGNTPISELNRLNDVSNDATNALLDACGLPR